MNILNGMPGWGVLKGIPDLQPLVEHSVANRALGGFILNPNGSMSTIRSGSVQHPKLNGGKPTLIPFIWDGQEVDQDTAVRLAIKSGKKWPAFKNNEEATMASKMVSSWL